jgi:hypothetical protein
MTYAIVFLVLTVVLCASWYYWSAGGSPSGQPPLRSLTEATFSGFVQEFNQAADRLRLLLLLSPT